MPDIILHHYYEEASPFSERVRLVLGLKDLAWGSVVTGYVPRASLKSGSCHE